MNKKDLIDIRYGTPEDFDFIEATWLSSLYNGDKNYLCIQCGEFDKEKGCPNCRRRKKSFGFWNLMDRTTFRAGYRPVIQRILRRPEIKIAVTCLKEEPSLCLGYCVSENDILHFIYTKRDWRKIGLMKDVAPLSVSTITHLTEIGKSVWKKKWPKAIFNPFA